MYSSLIGEIYAVAVLAGPVEDCGDIRAAAPCADTTSVLSTRTTPPGRQNHRSHPSRKARPPEPPQPPPQPIPNPTRPPPPPPVRL